MSELMDEEKMADEEDTSNEGGMNSAPSPASVPTPMPAASSPSIGARKPCSALACPALVPTMCTVSGGVFARRLKEGDQER